MKNLDKIKNSIGAELYKHIGSLNESQLKKQLSKLRSELGQISNKKDSRYYKLKDEEFLILHRLEKTDEFKYAKGGNTEQNMGVQFTDYKGKQIMFEPFFEKYYTNDIEFDTMEEAKKYIDSGSKKASWQVSAYRTGMMAKGGGVDADIKGFREKQSYTWLEKGVEHTIYIDKIEGNSVLFRWDGKYNKYSRKDFAELIEDIGATPDYMAKGGKTRKREDWTYELEIQPFYPYKNIANRWLQDNPPNTLKYKLAVLILRRISNPDEVLGITNDMQYGSLLRSLEKAKGESKHEMSWRTNNYSLAEAEKWTLDSLKEIFYLSIETREMAKGGKVRKFYMLGEEEVYIKDSSIGLDGEICLHYKKDDTILKCISKNSFDNYVKQGKLVPKMAKGGVTEHGLRKGDTITDDMFWSNEAVVRDSQGIKHKVNLEKGKRYAKGGLLGGFNYSIGGL